MPRLVGLRLVVQRITLFRSDELSSDSVFHCEYADRVPVRINPTIFTQERIDINSIWTVVTLGRIAPSRVRLAGPERELGQSTGFHAVGWLASDFRAITTSRPLLRSMSKPR